MPSQHVNAHKQAQEDVSKLKNNMMPQASRKPSHKGRLPSKLKYTSVREVYIYIYIHCIYTVYIYIYCIYILYIYIYCYIYILYIYIYIHYTLYIYIYIHTVYIYIYIYISRNMWNIQGQARHEDQAPNMYMEYHGVSRDTSQKSSPTRRKKNRNAIEKIYEVPKQARGHSSKFL